ncbi:MAG: SIMPL domain-containing protein [Limnothrix sp. RL_2_0]|nr:SIMPL domain-containing protein [Limnothrix sp. RL_2_0]
MKRNRFFVPMLAGLLCLGCSTSAIANEAFLRTISVTGQGEEAIATSISQVRLGVEVKGATAEQVQSDIANRSTKVVEFLKSKNVQKLTTTGINLQPQYDYNSGKQRLIGYIATNTVSFEVPTENAGSIMDEAVKAGATRIDGISFRATDNVLAEAEKIALAEAATDARAQADAVLAALGLSAKEIVQIQVNGSQPNIPMPTMRVESFAFSDKATTPVEGGEQMVNASVTLTISY